MITQLTELRKINLLIYYLYSSTSLVRASLVRGPSVVRGFNRQNFSSRPLKIAAKLRNIFA